jgi:VWFA-related protein
MNRAANRSLFFILLFAVLASSAFGQSRRTQPKPSPTPRDDESVRVETEEVKVNLLAFDETGNFFPGVKASDVVVTENNILHQPEMIRRVRANVLVVMDTGGEMRSVKSLDQTRKVARALIANLRDEDRVAILQYADKATIAQEWSTDKEQVTNAIGKTKFGLRSAFVDALNLAREYFSAGDLDNKHLVLITDGTDSSADLSKKNAAMRRLLSTDIAVHVLSYAQLEAADIEPRTKMTSKTPPRPAMPDEIKAGLPPGVRDVAMSPKIGPTINLDRELLKKMKERKADLNTSEEMLSTLVENTNGTMIDPETLDDMVAKTATVAKNIDSSYVLTYIPKVPFAEKGGERNIEVTSKRPGLVVQAKRKFVVPPKR